MKQEWIGVSACGRLRGVSKAAVQKAVATGRIKSESVRRASNGNIEAIEYHSAMASWNSSTDPDQAGRAGAPVLPIAPRSGAAQPTVQTSALLANTASAPTVSPDVAAILLHQIFEAALVAAVGNALQRGGDIAVLLSAFSTVMGECIFACLSFYGDDNFEFPLSGLTALLDHYDANEQARERAELVNIVRQRCSAETS